MLTFLSCACDLIDQDMSYQELVCQTTEEAASQMLQQACQRDETVDLFTGGDLTSTENKPFVDAFVWLAVAPTEQNQMSRDNQLTKEGVSRMQGAILATAYQDTDALAIMLDSTDDNIKAISNAMMAAAPKSAN